MPRSRVQFYTEQLGFKESWSFESGDTINRYVTDNDGVEIQLSDTSGVDEVETGTAWDHLALSVESVDDAFGPNRPLRDRPRTTG